MTLATGTRLGSYEILGALGAGGMGEVYRATDAKLKREVAIKVLPDAFARDEERMKRFEREAQVLASLNHPNVAAIYGVEEANGMRALVLELVEGPTLAERIASGPIPLDDALRIASQIAHGLEAAHEKAVIHRDLKPANVKLTKDGDVKILDFGLAKALEVDPVPVEESNSPTLTRATQVGVLLGTAAYMSPEQAKGKPADRRADVWSFGVVLYEMLTGRRAFDGEDVSETLAHVLTKEPDWSALPPELPSRVRELLARCLTKDPKQRLQAIGEARIAIEAREAAVPAPMASASPAWRRVLPWAAFGSVLGAAVVLGVLTPWRFSKHPAPVRVSTELGADASLFTEFGTATALSPDGAVLAFVATKRTGGPRQLYARRLDELEASPLPGTEGASSPFFSPDGEWIAFVADRKLKKVSVAGGAAVTLCDADFSGWWAEDGGIVFQPSGGFRTSLSRVSSAGGTPEPITTLEPDEVAQIHPQVLPGGKALLYTSHNARGGFDHANLVVQSLPTGTRRVVQRGGYYGRYVRSGHLAYIREGTLFVAPFDLDRLEVTGPPAPALEGVQSNPYVGVAQFAFSDNGTLGYLSGESDIFNAPIHWMDREGKPTPLRAAPASWHNPSFSPDGQRLAMQIHDGKQEDVWIYDWARDTLTRLTRDPADDGWPVWTPDGSRIAFSSARAGNATFNLYWQPADGTGEAERLTESENNQWAMSWHPSGKFLAFYGSAGPQTGSDVAILPMEGDETSGWKPGEPTVLVNDALQDGWPAFSPDGRFLAYHSRDSGPFEVYVRPFPGPGPKWQISNNGGAYPVWSRTRRELFYSTNNQIMVVPYAVEGEAFRAEKPRLWSKGSFRSSRGLTWRPYDLHPDGERFALVPRAETQTESTHVVLIFNFFDELRRIAPVGRR